MPRRMLFCLLHFGNRCNMFNMLQSGAICCNVRCYSWWFLFSYRYGQGGSTQGAATFMALLMRHHARIMPPRFRRYPANLCSVALLGSLAGRILVKLLRPTSPSLLRLAAGLVTSAGFVAATHWLLHPGDPSSPQAISDTRAELIQVDPRYCVLSLGFGAFPYVALASKVALAHIAHGERRSNLGVSANRV